MALQTDSSTEAAAPAERFLTLLRARLDDGRWLKLVLAGAKDAELAGHRVAVRPLMLRGQACLSFVHSHATRDITKNLPVAEGLALIGGWLGAGFRHAHLLTPDEELHLKFGKKGKPHLAVTRRAAPADAAAPAAMTHDREKHRFVELDRPFLVALGVTTAQHQLVPAMARKWKQINKFVEIFAHAFEASPLARSQQIRVADFGAGKGYLTFAIHDWLSGRPGLQARVTGVELRAELVAQSNDAAAQSGLVGLRFEQGDLRSHDSGPLNVMIALHACDTATDHAIHLGLRAGAEIILCSPCCHQQLRPQLLSPHPLRPVFAHGIHLEQQAEMVTDSLRALLLEAQGYDTQVFEFVALEHTRKNKMILAVKRATPRNNDAALAQIQVLKQFFGVREQCLETLLGTAPQPGSEEAAEVQLGGL